MTRLLSCQRMLTKFAAIFAGALVCTPALPVFAQHGVGHVGGGAGHVSAPHMSAPPAPRFSAPPRPVNPSAGIPPSPGRPIVGNHVIAPVPTTPAGALRPPVGPIFPRRPIYPRQPIFPVLGGPAFGFGFGFGAPFFGLGWGITSWWGPTCGPFWSWEFGCNGLPYYDYSSGYAGLYSPGSLESEVESEQNGPQIYENPGPGPIVYHNTEPELVQLYLKDGSIYQVADYWLVNDKLHFMTVDASGTQTEHVIPFGDLDLQKTIDANTSRGFRFVLRNEPVENYLQGTEQNVPSNQPPGEPGQPSQQTPNPQPDSSQPPSAPQ